MDRQGTTDGPRVSRHGPHLPTFSALSLQEVLREQRFSPSASITLDRTYATLAGLLGTEVVSFSYDEPPLLPSSQGRLDPKFRRALMQMAIDRGCLTVEMKQEIDLFCASGAEAFLAIRSLLHLFTLVRLHAALRQERLSRSPSLIQLRHFCCSKPSPQGCQQILCLVFAFQKSSPDELFDERHLRLCLARRLPEAELVPHSFLFYRRGQESHLSFYAEVQKKNGAPFSLDEISLLTRDIQNDLLSSIEKCERRISLPHSEEDFLRTILLLCQQMKRKKDLPQVMVHYRGQTDETVDFFVVLVRAVEKDHSPSFTITKFPEIRRLIPVKDAIAGNIRGTHQKQALSFIVQCEKQSFLRYNHSLDIVRARQRVVHSIESALGNVRDVNGGLFYQQTHLMDQLVPLLTEEEKKELHIVENLFHALTPCIAKTMICAEHMLTLFRHFRELRGRSEHPETCCLVEQQSTVAFVSFLCPHNHSPEEVLLLRSYLNMAEYCLAISQTPFSSYRFGFALCFSQNTQTQTTFISSVQHIMCRKTVSCGQPEDTLYKPSSSGDTSSQK